MSPRDRPPNRARLERAARAFARLLGEDRSRVSELLDAFERALGTDDPGEIAAAAGELDAFLATVQFEDGDWQPPAGGSDERA